MKKKAKNKKKNVAKKRGKQKSLSLPWLPLLIGFAILAFDQATKYLAHTGLPRMTHEAQWYPYNGIGIFENFLGVEFSIVHAINFGAAWGMFSGFQIPLLILRVLMIMGICLYLILYNTNKALTLPFTFVIAGAVGNIIDYFVYGHVVDMFHFILWGYDYPVFNIADAFICIGMVLLIVIPWCQSRGYITCKS